MKGRVLASTCGTFQVQLEDKLEQLKPLGIFRHLNKKIVVGDFVEVDLNKMTICDIYPRTNELIRPRIANIDLALVIVSLKDPDFASLLLDKFLAMLHYCNIPPFIIFTKSDLVEDKNRILGIQKQYEQIGIPSIVFSKRTLEGLEEIKKVVMNKTIALMGQTGVGKSSLINQIDQDFDRQIGEYSISLGRGKHQTKEVILLQYELGYLADTPGFSSLELECFKEEFAIHFPGFEKLLDGCKFNNCLHISEKECGIKKAVENHEYPSENYSNYLYISKNLKFRKDRFE